MADPVFDPNKPFDVEEATFDPNAPFEVDTGSAKTVSTSYEDPLNPGTMINPGTSKTIEAGGKPAQIDVLKDRFNEDIEHQGGWGLSDETRSWLGAPKTRTGGPLNTLQGLPADAVDLGYRTLQGAQAGLNTALHGLDDLADETGIADALSWDGNKFHPGNAIGSLFEAFPAGGHETGLPTRAMQGAPKDFLSAEAREGLNARYATATADEILDYAQKNGATIDEAQLRDWVKYRDEHPERGVNPVVVKGDEALEAAYNESREAKPGAQSTFSPAKATNKYANEIQNTVEDVTKDWKAKPEYKVVRNIDELEDSPLKQALDNEEGRAARGVIDGDGVVHLFADNLRPGDVKAAIFHEGLGHHGMTQLFNDGLDAKLQSMYESSPWFKEQTDAWIRDNPEAYQGPQQIARAADEVLAEMSEPGVRQLPQAKIIMDQVKNYVKDKARDMGFKWDMSEREVRSVLDMAHDAVINGDGNAVTNGFRYKRGDPFWNPTAVEETAAMFGMDEAAVDAAKRAGDTSFAQEVKGTQTLLDSEPRYMRGERQPKSLSSNLKTERDLDDLLQLSEREANDIRIGAVALSDIQKAGEAFDMRPSEFLKSGGALREDAAARVWRGRKILANTADRLAQMQVRAEATGLTPMIKEQIAKELATFQAVYSRVRGEVAEAARIMRTLREDVSSRGVDKLGRELDDIAPMLNDDEALLRFLGNVRALNEANGVEAAIEHISNINKVRPEDYAKSIIYNFMLSNPKTWLRNFVGSPLAYGWNAVEDIGKVATQAGRAELKGRLLGPLGAFSKADVIKTLTETADAFKTGQSGAIGVEGAKTGTGKSLVLSASKNPAVKIAGYAIENPQRIMAATDQLWSSMFTMGNIYGEAARVAGLEGLKGEAYSTRLAELVSNPTKEILEAAKKQTDRQLFRDHEDMSKVAKKWQELVRPRYEDTVQLIMKEGEDGKLVPSAKIDRPKSTKIERATKFALSTAVPFVPTIDAISRFVVRSSGPGSLLSPRIRAELMDPVTRTSALGRLAVGSSIMGLMAFKAAKGELTGAETGDYRETAATSAVNPPMSIKIGDQWVSYQGLDPLAGQLSIVASAVNAAKNDEEYQQIVIDSAIGAAASMKENSYGEAAFNLVKMINEGADTINQGKGLGPASMNFAVGQAANLATPGMVRFIDDNVDGVRRDTSGDGSIVDRTMSRIKGALPGVSDELPARHDPYGREVQKNMAGGLIQVTPSEDDPVVLELDRIESSNDGVQIGTPSKKNIKVNGEKRNLTADEFQKYQRVAGELLRQEMAPLISSPGWASLTEEEKMIVLKEIRDSTRKDARDALFGGDDE